MEIRFTRHYLERMHPGTCASKNITRDRLMEIASNSYLIHVHTYVRIGECVQHSARRHKCNPRISQRQKRHISNFALRHRACIRGLKISFALDSHQNVVGPNNITYKFACHARRFPQFIIKPTHTHTAVCPNAEKNAFIMQLNKMTRQCPLRIICSCT